jgi:hypothetical protein
MDRRRFLLSSLLAAALVAPGRGAAQKAVRPTIALLSLLPATSPEVQRNWKVFRDGLHERGYVEGDSVACVSIGMRMVKPLDSPLLPLSCSR